jgi:hypothetical protein
MTEPSTIERESLTPLTHERAVSYPETPADRFLSWVELLVQNRIRLLKVAIAGLVISAAERKSDDINRRRTQERLTGVSGVRQTRMKQG